MSDLFSAAHLWAAALDDQVAQNHKDQLPHIARLFTAAETLLKASVPLGSRRPATQLILEAADVLAAIIRGVINDILLPNSPLESLDAVDFRDWLVKHGANNKVVRESGIVRTWYDMSFQYRDGIQTQPSCAAGSCLGAVLRVLGTYKESVAYLPQGGFGEVVVAPLYRALLQAGVQIKFFRKVTGVELSADGQRIGRIQLDRQADIRVGDYAPTKRKSGFDYWPSQPFWEQIIDGGAMQAAGVDFESHWCDREPAGQEILEYGEDFDVVVLALPLGAYKEFPGQRSICEGILRRSSQFAQYVRDVEITPTLVMQIWSDWSLEALGSRIGKAVSVSGPPFLDIWADMSQILGLEEGQKTAQTLHYLCGSFPSKMYQWPATARDTPEKARREAYKCALEWLQRCSYALWPSAQDRGGFRWEVLTAPVSEKGEARLQYQFVNANIDPAACCTTSFAGTTQARLGPCETGITNLVLAGEGCRHGFNATAVEGAVMSGMAASRAICGEPAEIFGYDYLQREPFDS